ncbi:MAG: DEAD/DEAH box helicase [Planctomycetia bacterium]|nr:DEAD/DEAH box helicase [Planctomycetia bacterium]
MSPPGHPHGAEVLSVIRRFDHDPDLAGLVVEHRIEPPLEASYADLPEGLDPRLAPALAARGVKRLYVHQRDAYDLAVARRDVVVVTPTASGKTLCYNLPVLDAVLKDPDARALYLFPTKALSRDQSAELIDLMAATGAPLGSAVYDGDTPPAERRVVRDRAHVILSNPDMIHTAILPHHARWMKLFENLKYVVLDELHHYRGVFGSHLGNVLRRLRRICRFYGSDPVFIASSATIANAREFATTILGREPALVTRSGAPRGERHLFLVNPPILNPQLGLRASYLSTTRQVATAFLEAGVHTIVFAGSRVTTEVMAKYLKDLFRHDLEASGRVMAYRGGMLPKERREIERGLRAGRILGVVSTNALELGIDIGALDACVMAGYPGTVASFRQQSGRAGRRMAPSAAVLVLRSHPLDQHLADHPEDLLDAAPESAHANPDNLQVLVSHLKCAAFELPIDDGEDFGREDVPAVLAYLEEHGVLRHTGGRWHWAADVYPANDVSLRSVTSTNFVVIDTTEGRNEVIAEVDFAWAFTTIHEGAIYMVQSEQYHVDTLDWDRRKAFVRKVESEYYTDAISYAKVKVLQVLREGEPPPPPAGPGDAAGAPTEARDATPDPRGTRGPVAGASSRSPSPSAPAEPGDSPASPAPVPEPIVPSYGEVEVVRKAVGYKKIKFYTQENLGFGDILLPEDLFHTQATWFTVPKDVIASLRAPQSDVIDALAGVANLAHGLAAFLLMCDGRDLGVVLGDRAQEWFLRRIRFLSPAAQAALGPNQPPPPDAFEPTIFLYDQYSGGIGLAEALQPRFPDLLTGCRDRIAACACREGCPACVGPVQEVGKRAKALAHRILDLVLARWSAQGAPIHPLDEPEPVDATPPPAFEL